MQVTTNVFLWPPDYRDCSNSRVKMTYKKLLVVFSLVRPHFEIFEGHRRTMKKRRNDPDICQKYFYLRRISCQDNIRNTFLYYSRVQRVVYLEGMIEGRNREIPATKRSKGSVVTCTYPTNSQLQISFCTIYILYAGKYIMAGNGWRRGSEIALYNSYPHTREILHISL